MRLPMQPEGAQMPNEAEPFISPCENFHDNGPSDIGCFPEGEAPTKPLQRPDERPARRLALSQIVDGRHNRRTFLRRAGAVAAAATASLADPTAVHASHGPLVSEDAVGVLVDITQCIGCRLCEHACKQANGIDPGALASYDDQSPCWQPRRPAPDAFTVVTATRGDDE